MENDERPSPRRLQRCKECRCRQRHLHYNHHLWRCQFLQRTLAGLHLG
jgi:hypothetical protein